MAYLLFLFCCFVVAFFYWKLKWTLTRFLLALLACSAIGLLIVPFNFELGLKVMGFCVGLMIVILVLGAIGLGVAGIVAAPFILLHGIIKNIFIK